MLLVDAVINGWQEWVVVYIYKKRLNEQDDNWFIDFGFQYIPKELFPQIMQGDEPINMNEDLNAGDIKLANGEDIPTTNMKCKESENAQKKF